MGRVVMDPEPVTGRLVPSVPCDPCALAVFSHGARRANYDVRVAKALGEFTWHSHPDTDELFLVVRGSLTIRMEAGDVTLGPGQLYVVPRGVRHQPVSSEGAEIVLVEPGATVNTGDSPGALTASRRVL